MKMAKKKILVVDDEDYHRNLVKAFVEKLGYAVTDCASPIEALALLESTSFPLIITDLIMYDMDGMEFCEKVRETNRESKILALSGFIDLYESEKLDRAGFDGFLDKPIEMQKLKNAIAQALNG
jgi:CheY-like chemotaxis protein